MQSEIRQVLANLIRNSIDAMNGSRRRLLIRCRKATEWRHGTRGVVVTIADTAGNRSAGGEASVYSFLYDQGDRRNGIGLMGTQRDYQAP
jgi:signal transduction histidine kinase